MSAMSLKKIIGTILVLIIILSGLVMYQYIPRPPEQQASLVAVPEVELPTIEVLSKYEGVDVSDAMNSSVDAALELSKKFERGDEVTQDPVHALVWKNVAAFHKDRNAAKHREEVRQLPVLEQRIHQEELQRVLSVQGGILENITTSDLPSQYQQASSECFEQDRSDPLEADGSADEFGSFSRCIFRAIERNPSQEGCDLLKRTLGNVTILFDKCLFTLAQIEVSPEMCSGISRTHQRDFCYLFMAHTLNDVSFCAEVSDDRNLREECSRTLSSS